MNTGLPRHLTVREPPSAREDTSTSTDAAASVEASGRIWSINGQASPPTPTTPAIPVAIYKKSRRVGSAVSCALTCQFLFNLHVQLNTPLVLLQLSKNSPASTHRTNSLHLTIRFRREEKSCPDSNSLGRHHVAGYFSRLFKPKLTAATILNKH